MSITLTNENYYSSDADRYYMSVSQFKDFAGTLGHGACEATALKKVNRLIPQVKTKALLVGSYIDSYFEGTLDEFKAENPEIFKKTGDKGLLADYKQAEQIISRIENDALFTQYMAGQKQVIMTGNLFGLDWKIKMDSYHPDDKIVDLKVMKDMAPIWSDLTHSYMDFIRYWGYDIQGAVYQKIVEINTGKKLPFYIACATKETPCDIEIIEITQPYLDDALKFVQDNIARVTNIKNGISEAQKCHSCYYCKKDKILTAPVSIESIMPVRYTAKNDSDDTNGVQAYSLFDE